MSPATPIDGAETLKTAFKVYVYDPKEYDELKILTSGPGFCKDNQWGFEVQLHYWFLSCPSRTDDPAEADFFFVPQYTSCHINAQSYSEAESNLLLKSLVGKLKYFARTQGRDHLWVFGSGMGADGPFRDWEQHIKDSIFLMGETEYWNPYHWQKKPSFNFAKDIVVPAMIGLGEMRGNHDAALPIERRPWLGDFVGMQGKAASPREQLLQWAEKYPDLMHIHQDASHQIAMKGSVTSKFCFVPRGKSAWSSRLFRVLFAKCVPVILNDDYEIPFLGLMENQDNWLIRWPMREVTEEFASFLQSFDDDTLKQMVINGNEAKCLYVWPPALLDANHLDIESGSGIHDICPNYLQNNAFVAVHRLLYHKKRATKSSTSTFYMPDPNSGDILYTDKDFNLLF